MADRTNAPLILALGAGGGLALWYLLREDKPKSRRRSPSDDTSTGPLQFHLGALGLAFSGKPIALAAAVNRSKDAGGAVLHVDADAPAATYLEISRAFAAAGVPTTVIAS